MEEEKDYGHSGEPVCEVAPLELRRFHPTFLSLSCEAVKEVLKEARLISLTDGQLLYR